MHLKSVFPNGSTKWINSTKWLHDRREFRDFVRKCWYADTDETHEIFNAGSRIMSFLMYWVLVRLSGPIFGARYATRVSTHSTEMKVHAS